MDWRTAAAAVSHLTQQNAQNGAAQFSYASSSYTGQQPAPQPSSTGSAAYNPAYLPQAVVPQGYTNNGNYATGSNAQQIWPSQRSNDQQAAQAQAYGNRLAVTSTIPSNNAATATQYGGQYGVYGAAVQQVQPQQLLGVASKAGAVSDYQTSSGARTSYGGQDNRTAASYVAGGGVSSVSVSGVYGGNTDSAKYITTGGGYGSSNPGIQQYSQQPKADHHPQQQYSSYSNTGSIYGVEQLQQIQQQPQDSRYYPSTAYQDARNSQGLLGTYSGDATGILGSLGTTSYHPQQQTQNQQNQAYSSRYPPPSPSVGYGGVSLPPGRDYGTGRVSGGTHYQQEGSYGRSERPSMGSGRFDDRGGMGHIGRDIRDEERRAMREHERELREREMEQRDREREIKERERLRRERERENRREEERRNRSPVIRNRRDASPRKDDKRKDLSPRRETSHRHASPSSKESKRKEYVVKIEAGNVLQGERDCSEVARRHSKLYISPEFSKLLISWMGKENNIAIEKPASFEHSMIDVEDEPDDVKETSEKAVEKPQKGSVIWNARVMLMSGLTSECLAEFMNDKFNDKPPNFHKMLKFVALRRDKNAIMPAGGRWDKLLDGGDPATDKSVLIRTAVRTVKEATQIDLAPCKEWIRFAEIHYGRLDEYGFPSHKEISVFFLPRIADCLPSLENWHLQWNLRKQAKLERDSATAMKEKSEGNNEGDNEVSNGAISEKDGEVINNEDKNDKDKEEKKEKDRDAKDRTKDEPPEPGFFFVTKRSKTTKLKSMTISLDGLLDYDQTDRDEYSFELSLFAEAFAEMLQFKMGSQILQNLESLRRSRHLRKEEKKRVRQVEREKEDNKRRKTEDAKSVDLSKASEPDTKMEQDVKPEEDSQHSQTPPDTNEDNPNTEKPILEQPGMSPELKEVPPEAKENESQSQVSGEKKNETSKKDKTKKDKDRKKKTVDKDLLKAYRYFDKNRTGYLKADDLKKLLFSLGKFLSSRIVKDLTSCAVSETGRSRDEKVLYRVLAERESI